jgi:ribonuclease HII
VLINCYQIELIEAGCDEAGRGCLAGPVFAAAVILPKDFYLEGLNDSKQLTHEQRDELRPIIEREALSWAVAAVDHEEIDSINILNASFLAMHRAIEKLTLRPQYLVIDGNRFKAYPEIPHSCIIKGDGKYLNIAAASILAKTHRDEFMSNLHTSYPQYNWKQNKGYPTIAHRKAVIETGLSPFHRKTFNISDPQQQITLFEEV